MNRQRAYRARHRNSERVYAVRAGEIVHQALVARSIDAGLSVEAAERDSRSRAKVSADLTEILRAVGEAVSERVLTLDLKSKFSRRAPGREPQSDQTQLGLGRVYRRLRTPFGEATR